MKQFYLLLIAFFFAYAASANTIVYVTQNGAGAKDGTSWSNALDKTQLKVSLDNAATGNDFWIAAGTYYPSNSGNDSASFILKNGVGLYGGFAGNETDFSGRNAATYVTVLSGDLDQSNSLTSNDAFRVLYSSGNNNTAIIDGVTITGGNGADGAGIFTTGGNPIINNCRIINNHAGNFGGGVYCETGGNATITRCFFSGNNSSLAGGAMRCDDNSSPTIINCVFVGNSSSITGGIESQSYSSPTIINCSFSNNNGSGGTIRQSNGSNANIINCIVWNNGSGDIEDASASSSVTNSDVQGGWTGAGSNNINVNPSFSNSNLELLSCSRAIDAGTSNDAPANDFSGNARPFGAGIDMGAYEYQGNYAGLPTPSVTANTLTLTCSGGNGSGVTLTSNSATGNQWYRNRAVISGATSQTYYPTVAGDYTVQVTSGNCFSDTSAAITVASSAAPGDTSLFGNNTWNVYAFNAGDATDNGQSWNINYTGYYTDTTLNLDTRNKWSASLSPSYAAGYQGCPVQVDNHSWSAKRQGFSCGHYQINIPAHDDEGQLFVDGVKVWVAGCCGIANNVWEGDLGPTSQVVFRVTEGSGDSYGAISFVKINPLSISAPIISTCTDSSLTLTSSDSSGNKWYLNDTAIAGATDQTYIATVSGSYTVQSALTTCNASSSPVVISIGIPGDTSQYGNNAWNVYAFNAGDANGGSGAWNSNYAGYYVDTALQFDTRTKWNENTSPSSAPGFLGCGAVNNDNHSWSAKRKGFPCGHYQISIPGHDDAAQLFVNGVKVWEHIGCCDSHNNVWEGDLNYNTTVEFRGADGGGASFGAINFVKVPYQISGSKYICAGGQTTLDAGTHETYAWSTGETTQTISVNSAGTYSVTLSDGGCTQTAADTLQINSQHLDSLSISAVAASSCPGSKVMLTANPYVNNNRINTTRTYYIDASNLVNMGSYCGSDLLYGYAYNNSSWGFKWKDSGNAPVANVKIEFALGFEQTDGYGNNHSTSLNGTGESNITIPEWQYCTPAPSSPVQTFYPNAQDYVVGADNTFLINPTYQYASFGVRKWPDLDNYYAKITVTYQSDVSFAWTPGNLTGQQVSVYPTESTDYNLAANYKGCVSTATYHAVVNPVPTITAGGNTTICPGSSVTLTASSGTTYLWSNGDTTKIITVSAAGDYSVTVDNCTSSSPVTINYKPAPAITASGPTTFCPGYGIDLSADDGVSYAWSTGAITQSIHVTDSGSYSVLITDTTGCTQTVVQQINVKPLDNPVIASYTGLEICQNGYDYSDFYVSNTNYGNTYYANSDSVHSNDSSGYFNTAYAGTYTVTAKDVLGCTSGPSDPVVVTEAPGNPDVFGNNEWNIYAFDNGVTYWGYDIPWTHYIPDTQGYGIGTLNAYYGYYTESGLSFQTTDKWGTDGVPSDAPGFMGCPMYTNDYIFSWTAKRKGFPCGNYRISIPVHDDDAELYVNGTQVWQQTGYVVDSTLVWQGDLGPNSTVEFRVRNNGGGCQGAIAFTLVDSNVSVKPTISPAGPLTICSANPITLTSSAATGNLWNTGDTTQSIMVATTGNYTVTASNGCSSATSDAVVVNATQAQTYYRDADGDGYGDANHTTTACSATAPVGYVSNNTDCDDTHASVHPGAPEICDGLDNDCNGIIDDPCYKPVVAKASDKAASACLEDGAIRLTASGGKPPYQYSLDGATYVTTNTFTGLAAGSYTGYVKDSRNAVGTVVTTVKKVAVLVVTSSTASASACLNNGKITLGRTGGTSPFTYSIDGVNYVSTNVFNNLAAGTYTGYVKDAKGCTASKPNIIVGQKAAIVVTSSTVAASACADDGKITLSRTGGTSPFTYSLDGNTYVTTHVFTGLAAGSYTGYVKDAKGCVASKDSIIVGKLPEMVVSYTKANATKCPSNGSITLSKTGGTSPYLYSINGSTYGSSNKFSNLAPGSYTGYVKDAKGCIATSSAIVITGPSCGSNLIAATKENSIAAKPAITVMPNPARSSFGVQMSGFNGKTALQLRSLDGKLLRQAEVQAFGGVTQQSFDVADLAGGTYLLTVMDGKGNIINTKVVVAR